MGDTSIIARRLKDGHVQYGWCGNGGCYRARGDFLLDYYNTPEMVEYLFGLGQLSSLWEPFSEQDPSRISKTKRTGIPHELGTTEREIFSRIAFVDYGYFYDLDGKWYYIDPGPLRIKMPLELVGNHLNANGDEFDFTYSVVSRVGQTILRKWYESDPDFRSYLKEHGIDVAAVKLFCDRFTGDEPGWRVMLDLDRNHPSVLQYFDPWVLIWTDEDYQEITEIVLRKREDTHIETIYW